MAINPLQPPINYAAQMVNLTPAFTGFAEAMAQRRERTQEQAKLEEAARLKAEYATDLQEAIKNPSQDNWYNLAIKHPNMSPQTLALKGAVNKDRLDTEFNQGFQISSALKSQNPGAALAVLTPIIEGKQNKGEPLGIFQQVADAITANDFVTAEALVNGSMVMADPERFKKMVDAQTAATKAPVELTELKAKADKAVADALTAQATAANAPEKAKADAALATAKANQAAVEAQFAKENEIANLKKKAADLGLTTAQTNSALATTRKLNTEVAKAALELEALKASGGVDPDKKFAQEEKIRKEWQTRSKVYSELGGIYSNLKASADAKTGPGDIALITGFMKMLDPGSVVRETEFATARDTAGLFAILSNQAQKIQSGQLFALDSKQRQEYVTLAKQYLNAAEKKAGEEKKDLGIVVKNYNLNPENVFGATRNVTVDY